jgi:hypothetical protein
MHQNAAAAVGMPPATFEVVALWAADDDDYALGCECADPALQIERWGLDEDGQSS